MIRNAVVLAPYTEQDLVELQSLKVKPFQQVYGAEPSKVLTNQQVSQNTHVIKKDHQVVGMFCVNSRFHLGFTFASFDTPSIEHLIVDQASQGKGFATEACRMMPAYLRGVAPRARGFYMLVHCKNVGAYKACTRGGWTDTKQQYTLGVTGPQHILWLAQY